MAEETHHLKKVAGKSTNGLRQRRHRITFQPTACHVYYEHQESTIPYRKHYQGYLVFPESYFHNVGTYYFGYQYAHGNGSNIIWADYKESKLLTITTEGFGLADFRDVYNHKIRFTGLEPLSERAIVKIEAKDCTISADPHTPVTWFFPRRDDVAKDGSNDIDNTGSERNALIVSVQKDRSTHPETPSASCLSFDDWKRLLLVATCATSE